MLEDKVVIVTGAHRDWDKTTLSKRPGWAPGSSRVIFWIAAIPFARSKPMGARRLA